MKKTKVVFGGVGRQEQVDALSMGLDILVATPGRLIDLIEKGEINLSKINFRKTWCSWYYDINLLVNPATNITSKFCRIILYALF